MIFSTPFPNELKWIGVNGFNTYGDKEFVQSIYERAEIKTESWLKTIGSKPAGVIVQE